MRINSKGAMAPAMRGGTRDSASKTIVSHNAIHCIYTLHYLRKLFELDFLLFITGTQLF